MENEITLKPDEAFDYIKSNVKNYDTLEISYNRVFVPGEVLSISAEERDDNLKSLLLQIKMNGKTIQDTVELDLVEIKDEIVEIRHLTDDTVTVLIFEE